MKSRVVPAAQPPHFQRVVILIVMGIHRFETADLAWLLFQLAGLHGSLHGKVGIIFDRIGATPVGLAGIGFQHGGHPGL
ncbi:MAG: hypothetical protein BGO05_23265 [Rhizobiales bacterium 63-7]|nr:MAG: hypothetical protein BGO05_23265 [Rhizobiales bacterium 63-7]